MANVISMCPVGRQTDMIRWKLIMIGRYGQNWYLYHEDNSDFATTQMYYVLER